MSKNKEKLNLLGIIDSLMNNLNAQSNLLEIRRNYLFAQYNLLNQIGSLDQSFSNQ